jgi:hypothetical protein
MPDTIPNDEDTTNATAKLNRDAINPKTGDPIKAPRCQPWEVHAASAILTFIYQ